MFGQFYNSSIRRYCVLLGDLFSNVQVIRERESGPEYIRVPITFASKEHFIEKLDSITSINSTADVAKIETILPRMSLNLLDIVYNSAYKTSISNKLVKTAADKVNLISQYNPVPVKLLFELSIFTRFQDDKFQIIEQIWPYFQPHFSTKIIENYDGEIPFERNIRVVLQSLSFDDSLEGENTSRRRLETDMVFEVNGWLYPPIGEIKGEIKTVYVDFFANTKELSTNGNFESIDTQINPIDSTKENWDGAYIQGMSANIKIPTEGPSEIRGQNG